MRNETDIFNTKNTDDLPKKVKLQLKKEPFRKTGRNIMGLFKLKSTLSTDEMLIGLYRKHGVTKKRTAMQSLLSSLEKRNILKKTKLGVYTIVEKHNEE